MKNLSLQMLRKKSLCILIFGVVSGVTHASAGQDCMTVTPSDCKNCQTLNSCSGNKGSSMTDANGCKCSSTCNMVVNGSGTDSTGNYYSCNNLGNVCMAYAPVSTCATSGCPTASTSTAPAGTSGWTGVTPCQPITAGSTSNCVQNCVKGTTVYESWTPPSGQGWQTTACSPTSCTPSKSNNRSVVQKICREKGENLASSSCTYYDQVGPVTSGGTTWYQCTAQAPVVTYSCK